MSPGADEAVILAARHQLWRAGDLSWKLDVTQRQLYEEIKACASGLWATEGARKLGKSWAHGAIALETCIRNPGCQYNWAAITGKECRLILVPILEKLSADAPPECRGTYYHQDNQWRLPNGAWIQLIGAESREDCEKGRGPSSIGGVIDEAGFHSHLEYLVDSVLSPQMRRVKRIPGTFTGLILLVSTTPYIPTHPFCRMSDAAVLRGAYKKLTIWDSGWESKEEIERYIAAEALKKNMSVEQFMKTTEFRREYLSERVIDEEAVVFPEFFARQESIVQTWKRPIGFEQYVYKRVAIDPGMSDKTGVLYGYVDFVQGKVVVEDERLLSKPNTAEIALEIQTSEERLWHQANPQRTSRVIDDPQGRVVQDLWDLYKLRVQKAVKNDRSASIGYVRTWIQSGRLVIEPRCIQLRAQLMTATNDKSGRDFTRTKEGHYDLCAALMYFCRDLSITSNPYPHDFDALTGRKLPAHHPLMARREALGITPTNGLGQALLGRNRFVQSQQRFRKR